MKKLNIIYWISTGLLIAAIGIGSVFDIISYAGSVKVFTSLGYPAYLAPFLGVAHLLGLAAIVIPTFPRLKEWAYAGLVFDVIGAVYSNIAVGNSLLNIAIPSFALVLLFSSYTISKKKQALVNSNK